MMRQRRPWWVRAAAAVRSDGAGTDDEDVELVSLAWELPCFEVRPCFWGGNGTAVYCVRRK